ncbi:MAG: hypothetical protein AAGI38_19685 [Bacteroidota bacterium]
MNKSFTSLAVRLLCLIVSCSCLPGHAYSGFEAGRCVLVQGDTLLGQFRFNAEKERVSFLPHGHLEAPLIFPLDEIQSLKFANHTYYRQVTVHRHYFLAKRILEGPHELYQLQLPNDEWIFFVHHNGKTLLIDPRHLDDFLAVYLGPCALRVLHNHPARYTGKSLCKIFRALSECESPGSMENVPFSPVEKAPYRTIAIGAKVSLNTAVTFPSTNDLILELAEYYGVTRYPGAGIFTRFRYNERIFIQTEFEHHQKHLKAENVQVEPFASAATSDVSFRYNCYDLVLSVQYHQPILPRWKVFLEGGTVSGITQEGRWTAKRSPEALSDGIPNSNLVELREFNYGIFAGGGVAYHFGNHELNVHSRYIREENELLLLDLVPLDIFTRRLEVGCSLVFWVK